VGQKWVLSIEKRRAKKRGREEKRGENRDFPGSRFQIRSPLVKKKKTGNKKNTRKESSGKISRIQYIPPSSNRFQRGRKI